MSDLQTILDDAAYEDYLEGLRYDKEMQIATLQQCIYLLVEGETEEKTYSELLTKCNVDIKEIGVVIGNFNGCGNLIHILRLLKKTLSHDRPIIATTDNDEQGKRVCERLPQAGFNMDLITLVPMPSVVTPLEYPSGHKGGSFEEMFPPNHFIDQVFSPDFMPDILVSAKEEFRKQFRENKSWFEQVKKFCAEKGYTKMADFKVHIGIRLTKASEEVPPDIKQLSKIILDVRQKYPVSHLTDIAMKSERKGPGNSDGVISGSLASPKPPDGGEPEEHGDEGGTGGVIA